MFKSYLMSIIGYGLIFLLIVGFVMCYNNNKANAVNVPKQITKVVCKGMDHYLDIAQTKLEDRTVEIRNQIRGRNSTSYYPNTLGFPIAVVNLAIELHHMDCRFCYPKGE